jgi:O-antigen ligase
MYEAVLSRLQSWLVTGSQTRQLLAVLVLCLMVGTAGGALFAFLGPLLAMALLVAVAGGLMMLRSTQFTFFVLIGVICLLPFAALPIPNVGFSPTLLDLVLVVLLFSWLFQVARKRQKRIIGSTLGLPIVVLMVLACVSFVIGLSFASPTTSVVRQFAELLLNLLLFFLVINNVRSQKHLDQIVSALILAGFVASVIGVVLYFLPEHWMIRLLSMLRFFRYPSGSDVLVYVEDDPTLPLRATSTSINPNVLGGMLAIVAALTVPQLLSHDPLPLFRWGPHAWGLNWLAVPVLASMVLCLLLSYSRGAMSGLAGAVVILALLRYRKLLLFMLLVGLVLLLLPQTQWYVQHFLEGLKGEDLATQMRFGEYKDALILVSRYPWFGVGFAGAPNIDIYIGVSMVYLLIAEEMGLVGLGVFLLIMALTIRQILQGLAHLADNPGRDSILLGLLGALLAVLFTGIFDHYFFNINFQHAVALVWLCVGLAVATTLLPVENGTKTAGHASR